MPSLEAVYYPYFEPSQKLLRALLLYYGRIRGIVLKSAPFTMSDEVKELNGYICGGFEPVPLEEAEIESATADTAMLDSAFAEIAASRDHAPFVRTISDRHYIPLHPNKLMEEIRYLLKKHKLADFNHHRGVPMRGLAQGLGIPVEKRAATLILSCLAGFACHANGYHSITDEKDGFALNSQTTVGAALPAVRSRLAAAIVQMEAPVGVEYLTMAQFAELRMRFTEVREKFSDVVAFLSGDKLRQVTDPKELTATVEMVSAEFDGKVQAAKHSWDPYPGKWGYLGITALAGVASALATEIALPMAAVVGLVGLDRLVLQHQKRTQVDMLASAVASMQQAIAEAARVPRWRRR